MGTDQKAECKSLKRNGGGDRTRTCIAFRPAVFKTAALPLCDPSAGWLEEYSATDFPNKTAADCTEGPNGARSRQHNGAKHHARYHRPNQYHQRRLRGK